MKKSFFCTILGFTPRWHCKRYYKHVGEAEDYSGQKTVLDGFAILNKVVF